MRPSASFTAGLPAIAMVGALAQASLAVPPATGEKPPAIARPSKPSDRAVPPGYDGPVALRGRPGVSVTVYERTSSGRSRAVSWPPSILSKVLYASPYREPWMWIWSPESGLALVDRRKLYRISDDMRHQGCFVQFLVGLAQRLAPHHHIDALSLDPSKGGVPLP